MNDENPIPHVSLVQDGGVASVQCGTFTSFLRTMEGNHLFFRGMNDKYCFQCLKKNLTMKTAANIEKYTLADAYQNYRQVVNCETHLVALVANGSAHANLILGIGEVGSFEYNLKSNEEVKHMTMSHHQIFVILNPIRSMFKSMASLNRASSLCNVTLVFN